MESSSPLGFPVSADRTFPESDSDSLSLSEERGPTHSSSSRSSLPETPERGLDDNDDDDPIVVCGFAVRFPGDASSSEAFWKMMMEKRCASGEFPRDRVNIDGFYSKEYNASNTLPLRGGHFMEEDTARFDADFFSISPNEAASLDPMQRWLLEVAYNALENAGITMESVAGTMTGVFAGAFGIDYLIQLCRDVEDPPSYAALGLGISMLANRLSWFFDLRGPSIGMDSACSSTAMALDHACDSLRKGACNMAMIAGSNLAVAPETYTWLSNINFLSPSSRCYSFDQRANGYARGEGIGVVILKRLSDALRDGNTIRAVIRATGSNEDGKTPSITQPSREAQEDLIRETYRRASLSMAYTRFFESHGTGTAVGDPKEAQAIGTSFRKFRSAGDPLYVGALKSNIGHLEGCAALAALVKAIMVLERGVIPPNTNFERINPKIDARFLKIEFPEEPLPWPTSGLRRASVNSFGYGGSNSHIVLDDAYNYMRLRGINGKNRTATRPPTAAALQTKADSLDTTTGMEHGDDKETDASGLPKLLVLSSADKGGINRLAESLETWHTRLQRRSSDKTLLHDLAYTLDSQRSSLTWKSFATVSSLAGLTGLSSQMSSVAKKTSEPLRVGFVFSGQGAQWFGMARELLRYVSFETEITRSGDFLRSLGCSWKPIEELLRSQEDSKVDGAEYSQALCTIVQIAIVNLLSRFGVHPSAVVGHSSGEIAAAYASGNISQESAWKVAYFRGICSARLAEDKIPAGGSSEPPGSMISVGISEAEARTRLAPLRADARSFGISVACVNSPSNVTISGEEPLIDKLKLGLDEESVFSRKLRVPLAYHSEQMEAMASEYASLLGTLENPSGECAGRTVMLSSVSGEKVSRGALIDPCYWVRNMTSPVRFLEAVTAMCSAAPAQITKKIDMSHLDVSVVDHILEIGPHAALQGPIRDTLVTLPERKARPSITYSSALRRGYHAAQTLLTALGALSCRGVPVNIRAVNEPESDFDRLPSRNLLTDLPAYSFDHSRRYWHESRLSRNYALRSQPPSELLGVTSKESKMQWRHFLRRAESPWIDHHAVNGKIVYPAAGMMVMALEAAKQVVTRTPELIPTAYSLRDVVFENPIDLSTGDGVEIQTKVEARGGLQSNARVFQFIIESFGDGDEPRLNCQGTVSVELSSSEDCWEAVLASNERHAMAREASQQASECTKAVESRHMYSFLEHVGYGYGPSFQRAAHQRCSTQPKRATAELSPFISRKGPHVIHPATLDAIVQLCFTCLSSGGTEAMALGVPSRLGSLWISAAGLSRMGDSEEEGSGLQECVSLTRSSSRTHYYNGSVMQKGTLELKLWYDDLEFTDITSAVDPKSMQGSETLSQEQYCMKVSTKVAIDKLSSEERVELLMSLHPDAPDVSQLHRDLEILAIISLEGMIQEVDSSDLHDRDDWVKRYWSWALYHLSRFQKHPSWDDPDSDFGRARKALPELRARLSQHEGISAAYVAVSENLRDMVEGKLVPLELLMPSGLLDGFYAEGNTYRSPKLASAYVSLMAHQKPGMRILEVGGGTASTTKILIPQLSDGGSGPGALRCAQYDFTDISSGFLESARNYFEDFHAKMTFGTLNIENDPQSQGYEAASYDVVIADNVLHATLDLVQTMKNVRKLLKPGGKVFMHEWFRADGWSTGFIFGLLSGWWLGADTGRDMSPNVSVEDWDAILREAGFTGVDEVLRDFDEDGSYDQAYLVATAAEASKELGPNCQPSVTVVHGLGDHSKTKRDNVNTLEACLQSDFGPLAHLQSIAEDVVSHDRDGIVIYLGDYESPRATLVDVTEDTWKALQSLFETSRRVLWVSSGGGGAPHPDHGMVTGLARTLRLEHYDLQLVTLALEDPGSSLDLDRKVRHVKEVVRELAATKPYDNYEQDYVEIDGQLHTTRLIEAKKEMATLSDKLESTKVVSRSVGQSPFIVSNGEKDAHFIQTRTNPSQEDLKPGEIHIEVHTMSIQSRETAANLGWPCKGDSTPAIWGDYCTGTVIATGMLKRDEIMPGTPVLTPWRGPLASHIRVPSDLVVILDPSCSFADVCDSAGTRATAYHVIREVLKPEKARDVLVHDLMSPMGRAIASLLVADRTKSLWGTVTSQGDAKLAAEKFGLPLERILPKPCFQESTILTPRWKERFDVIIESSHDSQATSLLMSPLRQDGQYLTLQGDESKRVATRVIAIPKNATMINVKEGSKLPSRAALTYAAASEAHHDSHPSLNSFDCSELTQASAQLEKVNGENLVMKFDRSNTIDITIQVEPNKILRDNVTYVIAGLGGVGRGIARWMVQRGARHLLLLSRSSVSKPEAQELVSEMNSMGIQVEAPVCDVTSKDGLRSVLDRFAMTMPPVAGCIQTSMLMTEKMFQQMSHEDWNKTVSPKTHGSWNLHTELPRGLDFFVLLSSVMGILGSGSLSAYNAGNTYQDALARYRMARGERAVCLDLGAILDVGYLSDALGQGQQVVALGSSMFVRGGLRDILGLMDMYCDASHPLYAPCRTDDSQVVVGLRPPGQWKHLEDAPFTMTQPYWGHMHHVAPISKIGSDHGGSQKKRISVAEKLAASESLTDAAEVVSEALSARIGKLLGMPEEGIETQFPMESYGLDSLSAIHIRNWVGTVFDVDMPVFEVLGGTTFTEAGASIARQVLARREPKA